MAGNCVSYGQHIVRYSFLSSLRIPAIYKGYLFHLHLRQLLKWLDFSFSFSYFFSVYPMFFVSLFFLFYLFWVEYFLEFLFNISIFLLWRRQWHPTPVHSPGKSHGLRSLVDCSPWGCTESDSNFTFTFHFHALEKEMAPHSSVLAWRIPGMGEPDGLPSMGSHRVRHD